MTDPIGRLLEEHRALMAELEPLRHTLERLEREGEEALPAARSALAAAAEVMAGPLLRHARKEDEVLFPVLECSLGGGSPTAVMRQEHQEIHERAATFRDTLREMHEVEHPAIVAGGAAMREMARRGSGARELMEIGGEILRLLDLHFLKEEEVLFPMAREILTGPERAEIGRRMELIDEEPVR